MRLVTVFCWSSGSQGILYSGSHSHNLQATDAPNGLLKPSDEALQHSSIEHKSKEIDPGGL